MVRPPLETTNNTKPTINNTTIKFLCSYGGKIVPRYPDAKLRYLGGHTRVLSVPRSISFPELVVKLGELCGVSVSLRCQLPTEDLDALVSIKSDEDLANLIEEYDRVGPSSTKIRAFLFPVRSPKSTLSSPSSSSESPKSLSPKSLSPSSSFSAAGSSPRFVPVPVPGPVFPICYGKSVGAAVGGVVKVAQQSHYGCHHCHRNSGHIYLIHNGNNWQ